MKYCGYIGFAEEKETAPSVWTEEIVTKKYVGDILKFSRRTQNGVDLNDDFLQTSNRVSIVADPYLYDNFHSIRYVEWMNTKWKVSNVEVAYPRLILDLGGIYND